MSAKSAEEEKREKELYDAIVDGDEELAVEASKALVEEFKRDPRDVLNNVMLPALRYVGELYEKGEYFIADMVISAEAFKKAMNEVILPLFRKNKESSARIVCVFGTVQGDIHDLGKNLAASIFTSEGFEVIDLGTDVPPEKFVEKVKETSAKVVGLSALMTTTMPNQKKVIDYLKESGLRNNVIIIAGGAPITEEWVNEIGADICGNDVFKALREVKALLGLEVLSQTAEEGEKVMVKSVKRGGDKDAAS